MKKIHTFFCLFVLKNFVKKIAVSIKIHGNATNIINNLQVLEPRDWWIKTLTRNIFFFSVYILFRKNFVNCHKGAFINHVDRVMEAGRVGRSTWTFFFTYYTHYSTCRIVANFRKFGVFNLNSCIMNFCK